MARIFLLTVSNQYNAYNLILRLYATRNVMYTKRNGDSPKLRIFSFIPQQRRMQPNFMNHTYQTTNQTNTTQTTKTTTSTWVSPLTQFCTLTTEKMQILEYSYSDFNQFQKIHIQTISYISSITNLYISSIPKNLYLAWWTISYISSIPTWIYYLAQMCSFIDVGLVFLLLTLNIFPTFF